MEPTSQNNSFNAIKEARKLLNETRGNLSREETKKIRDKLRKKETVYNFLKEKEQKGSLTNREKNELNKMNIYNILYINLYIILSSILRTLENILKNYKNINIA